MPSGSGSGSGNAAQSPDSSTGSTEVLGAGIAVEAARFAGDHEGVFSSSSDDGKQDLHMESFAVALILGYLFT